jgi:hypothetical protein
MKHGLFCLLVLTGSLRASGQAGFIMHFDSVQAGRNGSGISVRETHDGYLVFCAQFSLQFHTTPHIYARKLDQGGAFIHEREYLVGDPRDLTSVTSMPWPTDPMAPLRQALPKAGGTLGRPGCMSSIRTGTPCRNGS